MSLPRTNSHQAHPSPHLPVGLDPAPLPGWNAREIEGGAIALTDPNGIDILLDVADWAAVAGFHWFARQEGNTSYAIARPRAAGRQPNIRMHRVVMGAAPGAVVDHINGNGLDNRRINLRACTHAENLRNSAHSVGASRFRGVSFDARERKWRAQITVNGKRTRIGYFPDEVSAARARDRAAVSFHGAFARLNFPGGAE